MFAAASRRPTLFPFSGMFSSLMHQNYVVSHVGLLQFIEFKGHANKSKKKFV
jgi:hypothetical protein